jgi:hypothetical protein
MRNADKVFASLVLVAASLGACSKPQPDANNVAIDNGAATPTDVETLPPDESSATPSNELVNGDDNADVDEAGNATKNKDCWAQQSC